MSQYQPTPPPSSPYTAGVVQPSDRYNVLAIVGFVLAFVVSIGAVVCGHIALSQIKRTGEKGHGLALAAVILGYAGIVAGIVVVIAYIAFIVSLAGTGHFSTN